MGGVLVGAFIIVGAWFLTEWTTRDEHRPVETIDPVWQAFYDGAWKVK